MLKRYARVCRPVSQKGNKYLRIAHLNVIEIHEIASMEFIFADSIGCCDEGQELRSSRSILLPRWDLKAETRKVAERNVSNNNLMLLIYMQ